MVMDTYQKGFSQHGFNPILCGNLKMRFGKCIVGVLVVIMFSSQPNVMSQTLSLPPAGTYYHGVYPGGQSGAEDDLTPADVESYEQTVGHQVAWVYFSNNWYRSSTFPLSTATWIRERGAVPFIRLMLRSSDENPTPDPRYTLDAMLNGDFDAELVAWGQAAKAFGTPLIVEWGTEMNGFWFAWNASWNGQEIGSEKFRRAYRHIVETIRAQGATNITWVFHVNDSDNPEESWNAFENYYPGDDVVDWFGVSVYSAQSPQDTYWTNFTEQLDVVMPRLTDLANKPVFLLEFGAAKNNPLGDQAQWADEALTALLSNRWPEVKGFSWWNERWQNDDNPANDTIMRVQDNPVLAEVFRKRLAEGILERPRLE
jgi:Glycosyl hydrolase family 26